MDVRPGFIAIAFTASMFIFYNLVWNKPNADESKPSDENVEEQNENAWAVDEAENLMKLVVTIANEQAAQDTMIHKSVSCNQCNMSPLRGTRFKCVNCIDFDLCAHCETLGIHSKTHLFLKISIPIPPHANPRSLILKPFYPGMSWTTTKRFDTSMLENETHFDTLEIEAYYEQFLSLSTIDGDGGITRETFNYCLGYLQSQTNVISDRMFKFFDQDDDGIISFEEMVRGCSVLNKGTYDERLKFAFEGYDIDGDGLISRAEFTIIFKAYFQLSMGMVRGAVKVIEQGMLENFDDEAEKPVSAAFGAPFDQDITERDNPAAFTKLADSDDEISPVRSDSLHDRNDLSPARSGFVDVGDDQETSIIDIVSQNAISEMVAQIFESAGELDKLDFQSFTKAVAVDVNILAWFESLGSVF